MNVMIGRCFKEPTTKINSLNEEGSLVVIQGQISCLEILDLQDLQAFLLTFRITTDDTAPFFCKAYLSYTVRLKNPGDKSNENANALKAENRKKVLRKASRLKEGMIAMVRGEYTFDTVIKEMTVTVRDLMEV